MISLVGFLAASSPWLLGAAIALIVAPSIATQRSFAVLLAGIGGFLGYLVSAGIIWGCDQLGASALSLSVIYMTLAAVFFVLLWSTIGILTHVRRAPLSLPDPVNWITVFLSALIFAIFFLAAYQNLQLPTQGWDTLSFWAKNAHRFILHSIEIWDAPFRYKSRHPPTISFILAWSSWSSHALTGHSFPHWPWFLCLCSLGLIAYGFAKHCGLTTNLSLLITLIAISTPLIENHGIVSGYGELLIAVALTGGSALICIGLSEHRSIFILAGVSVCLTPIFIKNIGLFYAAMPAFALYALWIKESGSRVSFSISLLSIFVASLVALSGFSFTILNNRVGIELSRGIFHFGGYSLEIMDVPVANLVENQLYAWFVNSSFSQLGIALLILILATLQAEQKDRRLTFIILVILFGLGTLTLSQFSQHGYSHAIPSRDTGNSRFSIPFFSLVILGLSILLCRWSLKTKSDICPDSESP